MSEHDPIEEAADALKAAGHEVKPWGDDLALWLLDGETISDSDLLALAIRLGLMDNSTGILQ